ncbi:MAG TPA: dimethyl sulfoxide reductase anchor subunit [Candidatus Aminicenantes bacterium]|nr:dimethyl sulfoxide reductase anchor subunit [Candidatus Aminicenantes bacterium]HRY65896.1 dimethyl sulfoxide reductase anchor subunit [Candidatus Aminicenantes bacterium]HRZ72778.1 dimethyl sulfoxide reductase anchor subunit [Candidatus Aminicenantes bacterium]
MLKEWPLVAFTVLGQTAVGVFWFFHLPFLVRGRLPAYGWRLAGLVVLAVVVLLTALAAAVSFFHLSHPFRARRALGNLRSSWLSREILSELLFLALAAAAAWLDGFRNPGPELERALLAAAGLAGLLFLFCMTKVYMLPSAPAWRRISTPLAFLSTTLVAGAVTTELVVRLAAGPGVFEIDLMPAALVLIAVEIALAAVAAPLGGLKGFRPAPSLRPNDGPPPFLHRARIVLLAAGFVSVAADIATGGNDIMKERGAGPFLILAFLFVLAGEIAGRFHFYGLMPRPGDRRA